VNILGCFAIGILNGWIERQPAANPSLQLFVSVGILGGFTTFSTFGWETMQLLRMQQTGLAVFNVVASLSLGFGAVWLGRSMIS
jgi:CrcB protein